MNTGGTTKILHSIREVMTMRKVTPVQLHAVIIPTADVHQNEYLVAVCDRRRAYVSNFTAAAGTAVITKNEAALWTDGRYFSEAEKELDSNWMLMKIGLEDTPSIEDWLCSVLPRNSNIGVNPYLYSFDKWEKTRKKLKAKGQRLIGTERDIVDAVWSEKPERPCNPLVILGEEVTGMSTKSKISILREKMDKNDIEWLVISALDDIAWLLNMRGSDIDFNPLFFSYALLGKKVVEVFIRRKQVTCDVLKHLSQATAINVNDYDSVFDFVKSNCQSSNVWLCKNSSTALVTAIPKQHRVVVSNSPVAMIKAVKNSVEINGMKEANVRDSVAFCNFLHWLEKEVVYGHVTEISAAEISLEFRKQQKKFVSESFRTISSSGSNSSIIHYSPSIESNRPVTTDALYMFDSGAHYLDGTTDATRTVHFGTPTDYEKSCFTRVLKGYIALCRAVFPLGTKGHTLDTFARMHLWKVGLDYKHGTGHCMGTYLNVVQGPIGLFIWNSNHIMEVSSETIVKPGMVITDEPGFYEPGKFGIRIEVPLLCVEATTERCVGADKYLTFEPLAFIPIQKKMIEKPLLSEEEIQWVNNYHSECKEKTGRLLKDQGNAETYKWLVEQTIPL